MKQSTAILNAKTAVCAVLLALVASSVQARASAFRQDSVLTACGVLPPDSLAADSCSSHVLVTDSLYEQPRGRKKVALVLSGGGAKGTAHVGALKVLERAGIPIDIITGTSMGSIVGGIYACGHRADELDSVIRAQNWTFVLSDREDLSHQSLREREKQNTYVISKSLKFGKKTQPTGGGFIMGKNISSLFDALTAPYHDSIDFNMLPIPFACVATDVVDNSEQVFNSGVLSTAMRASMAIPGVFAPVRMGDRVLVDGGLRNNYPADVARAMGADVIIGVDVSSELKTASELNSASSILMQIIDHNCKDKFEENRNITDIMIRVNTKGYSSASFSKTAIDSLIRRGEEAAMKQWDKLLALREELGNPAPDSIPARNWSMAPEATFEIDELRFEGMSKADETYIRTKFRLREGGKISRERADIIATAIRQDLYYKTATFRILHSPEEATASVTFIAGERRDNQINIGARFDSEEMVAFQANVELPIHTRVPMDVELTLRLGKRVMARGDWSFHPISFFRPTVSYAFRNNDIDLYQSGKKAYSLTYNQHSVKLSLFNFNVRNFNISIGANWDYFDYRSMLFDGSEERPENVVPKDKGYVSYEALAWFNSENDWHFPTSGVRFHAWLAYDTDNFYSLNGKVGIRDYAAMCRINFPIGNRFAVQPMVYFRTLYCEDDMPFVLGNVLGGEWYGHYFEQQIPFAGVGYVNLVRDKLVGAQLQAQYKLTTNNIVLLRFSAGQDSQTLDKLLKDRTMIGGSLSYYFNSIFGPLGGSIGYNNITKKFYYYINLGFVF